MMRRGHVSQMAARVAQSSASLKIPSRRRRETADFAAARLKAARPPVQQTEVTEESTPMKGLSVLPSSGGQIIRKCLYDNELRVDGVAYTFTAISVRASLNLYPNPRTVSI